MESMEESQQRAPGDIVLVTRLLLVTDRGTDLLLQILALIHNC